MVTASMMSEHAEVGRVIEGERFAMLIFGTEGLLALRLAGRQFKGLLHAHRCSCNTPCAETDEGATIKW